MFMKRIIYSNTIGKKLHFLRWDFKRYVPLIALTFLLFCGIVFGAVSARNVDKRFIDEFDFIFRANYDIKASQGLLSVFVASLASSGIFLAVLFLFGLSLWTLPFTVMIPFCKGYGYGLCVGLLYQLYSMNGILYNILIVLPGVFVTSAILIKASETAAKNTCKMILCFVRSAVRDDPHLQMKRYFLNMLWLLGGCIAAAVLDMLFSLLFSWIFAL